MTVTRRRQLFTIVLAAAAGAVFTAALDRAAFGQQEGMKRTILKRVADPGNPNYEIVLGISELAPGATSGKHRHPGVEVGYLLQGTLTVEKEGGKTETIKTGEALDNANNGAHTATNKGTTPVKTLAVWVVQKDKPLAEPVK